MRHNIISSNGLDQWHTFVPNFVTVKLETMNTNITWSYYKSWSLCT